MFITPLAFHATAINIVFIFFINVNCKSRGKVRLGFLHRAWKLKFAEKLEKGPKSGEKIVPRTGELRRAEGRVNHEFDL